jgi:fucose permease
VGRFAYALVLPHMQRSPGLSYAQAGPLDSANTLGVGVLVSHWLLYAVGYRCRFYLSLALQALTLALLAFASTLGVLLALRCSAQGV